MKKGFTLLEVILVLVAVAFGVVLFFVQKLNIDAMERDEDRKIAINAMYFNLEEDFYAEHDYYPETISQDNLRAMDPNLFTDPLGLLINTDGSSYSYQPINCTDGKCKSYTLRATLEKEDTFIRESRN
jgi:prepilin-type N-terminal cleavage/methylation domain-containing protein